MELPPTPAGGLVPGRNLASERAGGSSRKRRSSEPVDEDGKKGPKRKKPGFSCVECKRRKIKCNREMPCDHCTKRGQPAGCEWEELQQLPATIARASDVEDTLARIKHIEEYLKSLPPTLVRFRPFEQVDGPRQHYRDAPPGETFSDTEEAAAELENNVFKMLPTQQEYSQRISPQLTSREPAQLDVYNLRLTPALTSILSQHPFPLSCLDIDFGASAEAVDAGRRRAIMKLHALLPERTVVNYLVDLYFTRVSWLFHHLHSASFLAELAFFQALEDEGRAHETDPAWLALLLMVCAVSIDSTHSSRSPLALEKRSVALLASLPIDGLQQMPEQMFEAAQRALALSSWESRPQMRTIAVIILFTQYLQLCSPSRGQPSALAVWLASGIRIAQSLGLHRLGSSAEIMPADDPAVPPGTNSVKRETAKRLWAVLLYQDWMAATPKTGYLVHPHHFDCDDPSNVNDSDLSSIDWKLDPLPSNVLTDSSPDIIRAKLARQVREVFDTVVLPKTYSYESIVELDKGFRDILDSLPDRYTLELQAGEADQPMLRYQRHFVLEGIHHRIFRLHRPFLTRGYSPSSKYHFSTRRCIQSAEVVIVSTHNFFEGTRDIHYSYSHVLGAALALYNDLFLAIDQDLPAAEIDAKRELLALAGDIFSKGNSEVTSPTLLQLVQQGNRILQGLSTATDVRRVDRVARALVSASGGGYAQRQEDAAPESFADVLKRISTSLSIEDDRHTGTPPPSRLITHRPTPRTTGVVLPPGWVESETPVAPFYGTTAEEPDFSFFDFDSFAQQNDLDVWSATFGTTSF